MHRTAGHQATYICNNRVRKDRIHDYALTHVVVYTTSQKLSYPARLSSKGSRFITSSILACQNRSLGQELSIVRCRNNMCIGMSTVEMRPKIWYRGLGRRTCYMLRDPAWRPCPSRRHPDSPRKGRGRLGHHMICIRRKMLECVMYRTLPFEVVESRQIHRGVIRTWRIVLLGLRQCRLRTSVMDRLSL